MHEGRAAAMPERLEEVHKEFYFSHYRATFLTGGHCCCLYSCLANGLMAYLIVYGLSLLRYCC